MSLTDLVELKTDDFLLSIKGTPPHQNSFTLRNFSGGQDDEVSRNILRHIKHSSEFGDTSLIKIERKTSRYSNENTRIKVCTNFEKNGLEYYLPIFFENINYHVQLTSFNDKKYTLWHEHSSINNNLAYFEQHQSFSGTINFRNNVGLTQLSVLEDGKLIFQIDITVFSIKIDFLKERLSMINELSNIHNHLVFEMFNPTKNGGSGETQSATGLEWLVNFYNLSDQLLGIIERIEKKAHQRLNTESKTFNIRKIKRTNSSLTKKINKYGKDELFQRNTIDLNVKSSDLNTPENKFIKYLMKQTTKQINKWRHYIDNSTLESIKSIKNEHFYLKILHNEKKLRRRINNEFWLHIEDSNNGLQNKTNFLFHNEFVKFEKLIRLINKGINIQIKGSKYIYTLSMEDLYEVWTFCKLVQIISEFVHNDSSAYTLKIKTDAFRTVLKTGKSSKIRVNDQITIATNRLFKTSLTSTYFTPLVNQQPDLIFEIENKQELNILDAKYKIEVAVVESNDLKTLSYKELISKDISNKEVRFKPKDEDINTMHRYKDAIQTNRVIDDTPEVIRAVKRGIILYPHKPPISDAGQIENYLTKFDKFKIGAIPFSPGNVDDNWKSEFTTALIVEPHESVEQIRILARIVQDILSE
ncbi:hypothetical protein DCC85_03805 [Paenibacillus sp. CAA11]|uniref:DUF2357 domain-containing protein n=1 Tax=Paenibacillus sp. CAA11 TaxID=1532905 RepID=UPI000D3371D2|nr:DUF2357 domain-containing protein [Paenibacillus sp. CAA11]AWB43432.1 hypothetical protein DCC85_03805 [Paenibacillus sp. CAA11]